MHWYVRRMSEIGRRGGYRHWVWVLNQGPLVSTTNVFRLEHMLTARTSPTVTSSTLKVPSPERRMTTHSCNQSCLPSTTSYPPADGSRQSAQARPSTDPTRQQAGFVDRMRRINPERRSSWLERCLCDSRADQRVCTEEILSICLKGLDRFRSPTAHERVCGFRSTLTRQGRTEVASISLTAAVIRSDSAESSISDESYITNGSTATERGSPDDGTVTHSGPGPDPPGC